MGFNDEGLGLAMGQSFARDTAVRAEQKVEILTEKVMELQGRLQKLENVVLALAERVVK